MEWSSSFYFANFARFAACLSLIHILKALTELAKAYDLKDDITATAVARYPDIFSVRKAPEDEDKIFNSVKQVLDMALDGFIEMRIKEGENLRNCLLYTSIEKVYLLLV